MNKWTRISEHSIGKLISQPLKALSHFTIGKANELKSHLSTKTINLPFHKSKEELWSPGQIAGAAVCAVERRCLVLNWSSVRPGENEESQTQQN